MPRKKTHEEYVREVMEINQNIEVLGVYSGSVTKILHRCKICGHKWHIQPNHVLHGIGCPECAGVKRKTHEKYIEEVFCINPNIEVIGQYINNKVPILHKCKICGYEWYAKPSNILNGFGCSACSKKKKKTHEEYVRKVTEINPNIEVVGEYINDKTKILHRCKIDGYEWYSPPHSILQGWGCSKCNISKGEKTIEKWLNKENILYETQKKFSDCKNINPLPFDFYLPEYDICIEYQGQQHYESIDYFGGKSKLQNQVKRDNIKRDYCQRKDMLLFEIPYYSDLNEELIKLYKIITTKNIKKEVVT